MIDISVRQKKLLIAIIEEFIETGEAVGSINLQTKYGFDLSPATIRNEMAELVNNGYLYMKHSSGGRIPTTKGLRLYVTEIEEFPEESIEIELESSEASTNLIKRTREDEDLIRESLEFLHNITQNTTVALIDNDIYYAGLSSIVEMPEFQEIEKLKKILMILEDYRMLSQLFTQNDESAEVKIIIGEESGIDLFTDYAVVFTEIQFGSKQGYLAVIGPNRLNYSHVIPAIKYIRRTFIGLIKN